MTIGYLTLNVKIFLLNGMEYFVLGVMNHSSSGSYVCWFTHVLLTQYGIVQCGVLSNQVH